MRAQLDQAGQQPDQTVSALIDVTRNGGILALLWFMYAAVRSITRETTEAALSNARRLEVFQEHIGIGFEADLQRAVDLPAAFVAANIYYLVHFPITMFVLVLAFVTSRKRTFSPLRNGLIFATGIALVLHLAFPMAPPRMLPGYLDAGNVFGPNPYSLPGSDGANQLAAMPSMHVAWAVLVGWAVWTLSSRRAARAVALAHPSLTAVVVVMTGHHFATDVAIGALLAAAWLVTQERFQGNDGDDGSVQDRPSTPRTNEISGDASATSCARLPMLSGAKTSTTATPRQHNDCQGEEKSQSSTGSSSGCCRTCSPASPVLDHGL